MGLFIQSLSSVSEDTQVTEKSSEWAVVASCDYITNHMNIYCIDDYTLSQRDLKVDHSFIIISQDELL